jgi:SNF2 family DNA or RNA helicase
LSVTLIPQPSVFANFLLSPPLSTVVSQPLTTPSTIDLDGNYVPDNIEILDLLDPLTRPDIHGTIFVKTEQAIQRKENRTKPPVEPFRLAERKNPIAPQGLDIFELLLPVLIPPAATDFQQELLFPHELYAFQRAGVKWLFENESALLADDMGLGKTVQAITAFRALVRRSLALQALVICPKSVLTNWMRELERWAPELVAIRIHGPSNIRQIAWKAYIGKCHVLVTTYETVRQDFEVIKGGSFDVVIADEVQRIKNPRVAVSRAVRDLTADRRWGLSGTPLENTLQDLVSVFSFLKPDLFAVHELPSLTTGKVRQKIQPYILRRRKEEALPDLPPKVVDTKLLELSESQFSAYQLAEKEGVSQLRSGENVTVQHVLALIQKLKQICNFDPKTGDSSKLGFLVEEYLEEACTEASKAIIISQYVGALEEIAGRIKEYNPLLYTGKLSDVQRDRIVKEFNMDGLHKVLLLSLRAGGLGLNLTRANYVLHFDRWWNPAVEHQAEDRTHRIGQAKTVFVTRLICQGTIEERIENLLERKKILFHDVIDELSDVSLERILSEEELFGLFGLVSPRRQTKPIEPEKGPPTTKDQRAVVISPETPFSNVANLRAILRDCEEFIWWADPHFGARGLEELIVSVDPALTREVRILSGPANVDERAKRDFARFKEELLKKGISAEWKVMREFSHDRFILGKNSCYNVPPINSLLRGSYSELIKTPNRPPFNDWWAAATSI